jgi:multiple antibiotic resistance protein
MDPFGNMVSVNSILSKVPSRKRQFVILREAAIATAILLVAGSVGGPLLRALGLEEYSLRLCGGIVLFLIALGMVFPSRRVIDESADDAPLIVPIAMPLIAGPSAISMVVLFSEKHSALVVASAILISSVASATVLAMSSWLFSILGRRGAVALERLIGMILIMISVQMILDGLDAYMLSRA